MRLRAEKEKSAQIETAYYRKLLDDLDFPPLVRSERHPADTATLREGRPANERTPRPHGVLARRVDGEPWVNEVSDQGKVGKPERVAYSAMPERAVLAAYGAYGVGRVKAEKSREFLLARLAANGELGPLLSLKAASAEHRKRWILSDADGLSGQLSFIGRALPPAPASLRTAALLQHRKDLTSTFTTCPSILADARRFIRSWAKKHLMRSRSEIRAPDWPSVSACLERPAGKGGLLKHMLSNHAFDDLPCDLDDTQMGAVAGMGARFTQAALEQFAKNEFPTHKASVLSERGVKTRVVTVGPAWCQILGHPVRRRLLAALKRVPGVFAPRRNDDGLIIKEFIGACGDTLVSTDLTRATDLLPFDLVSAVVQGLSDSGRLSKTEIEVLRALTGPQRVRYGSEEIVSSRGILMGLPTSWCILSLIHLFWLSRSRSGKHSRSVICGDDALFATSEEGAAKYKEVVRQCGGEPSEGKHYERSGVGGLLRGVFIERLYEFKVERVGQHLRIVSGYRVGAIPVKGLTSNSLPREFFGEVPVRCDSFGLVQILCIDQLAKTGAHLEALKNYVRIRVPWLPAFAAKRVGLAPGHPLTLGGFILSDRTPEGDLLALQCRNSGKSFSATVRREVDPDWRTAHQWCGQGRELAVAEGELVDLWDHTPLHFDVEGPLLPTQVRLPEGNWSFFEEEERYMATMVGMFYQVKAFSERVSGVYVVRAKALTRILRRLRSEGAKNPDPRPLEEVQRLTHRIAWRIPDEGTQERGTSWIADSSTPRQRAINCVMQSSLALQARLATKPGCNSSS